VASGGGGGGGKIPWKLIIIIAIYLFMARSVPALRPANIAHALAVFAAGVQAGQQGG
jgi:hypothetical protein